MLALASLLVRLRDDPGTVGKRYELDRAARPAQLPRGARGSPACAPPRRATSCRRADSFRLGQPRAADRLPRRPHALRGAAAGLRAAAARAPARPRSGSGSPTRSACGPARRSRCSRPAATRSGCAWSASCGRSRTRAGSRTSRDAPLLTRRAAAAAGDRDPPDRRRGPRRASPPACARWAPRRTPVPRRHHEQRRVPRHPRRRAARRRARDRARLPVRARSRRSRSPRASAAAPSRCCGRPARIGRRSRSCWRARRSPSRCPPRSPRPCSSGWRSARWSPRSPPASPSLELAPTLGQVLLVVAGVLALSAVATAVVARRVMREPIVAGLREE